MNKDELKVVIAKLLNVPESDSSLAFELFKKRISEYIKVGEAIRIKELGVFQLKEQLDHSDISKLNSEGKSNLTLLFSPESSTPKSESLFINLELDKSQKNDTEFNDQVFQLGLNKPLITDIKDGVNSLLDDDTQSTELESNIEVILNDSEKLDNFDVWDDYLKSKETTNILSEENEDISLIDEEDDEHDDFEENILDEDFSPLDDQDILDDYIENNNFINDDELEKLTEEQEPEQKEIEINLDEKIDSELKDITEIEDIDTSVSDEIEVDNEIQIGDDLDEISGVDESKEDILINELPEVEELVESDDDISRDKLEISVDEATADQGDYDELEDFSSEDIPDKEIELMETSLSNDLMDDEVLKGEKTSEELIEELNSDDDGEKIVEEIVQEKNNESLTKTEKRKSPVLWLLISAFIVIGLISIYYLFIQKESSHVIDEGKNQVLNEEIKTPATISDENELNNNVVKENLEPDPKSQVEDGRKKTEPSSNTDSVKETEIADNIYYDGFTYSVQVSSWKKRSIAEKEVNRLIKNGYPAYIIKAYIAKFNGTWHRVRIGPYASLAEANNAKNKVK